MKTINYVKFIFMKIAPACAFFDEMYSKTCKSLNTSILNKNKIRMALKFCITKYYIITN